MQRNADIGLFMKLSIFPNKLKRCAGKTTGHSIANILPLWLFQKNDLLTNLEMNQFKMSEENYKYTVKCRTCHTNFKVELFESHEKNLILVDKKDWYCDTCKKEYFKNQALKLSKKQL